MILHYFACVFTLIDSIDASKLVQSVRYGAVVLPEGGLLDAECKVQQVGRFPVPIMPPEW